MVIDEEIEITILKVQGKSSVSLGIKAPKGIRIYRGELVDEEEVQETATVV